MRNKKGNYKVYADEKSANSMRGLLGMATITFGSSEFKKYVQSYADTEGIPVGSIPKELLLKLYQNFLRGN